MAEKNWLIRTKNKQILGPATKEKVIELIEKGSLTADDEITCGNGYWFWIREEDLIDKYLYGDIPQSFNPISEAQDVITAKSSPDGITASVTESPAPKVEPKKEPQVSDNLLPDDDDLAYPDEADLDYPDMGDDVEEEELTPNDEDLDYPDVGEVTAETSPSLSLSSHTQEVEVPREEPVETIVQEGEENFLYPSAEDLEYPMMEGVAEELSEEVDDDATDPNMAIPSLEEEPSIEDIPIQEPVEETPVDVAPVEELPEEAPYEEPPLPKKKKKKKVRKKKRKVATERKGNDRYLFLILALIIVAIGVVFYYYTEVLNKPFPVLGINKAHAQSLQSLSKKKSLRDSYPRKSFC